MCRLKRFCCAPATFSICRIPRHFAYPSGLFLFPIIDFTHQLFLRGWRFPSFPRMAPAWSSRYAGVCAVLMGSLIRVSAVWAQRWDMFGLPRNPHFGHGDSIGVGVSVQGVSSAGPLLHRPEKVVDAGQSVWRGMRRPDPRKQAVKRIGPQVTKEPELSGSLVRHVSTVSRNHNAVCWPSQYLIPTIRLTARL